MKKPNKSFLLAAFCGTLVLSACDNKPIQELQVQLQHDGSSVCVGGLRATITVRGKSFALKTSQISSPGDIATINIKSPDLEIGDSVQMEAWCDRAAPAVAGYAKTTKKYLGMYANNIIFGLVIHAPSSASQNGPDTLVTPGPTFEDVGNHFSN